MVAAAFLLCPTASAQEAPAAISFFAAAPADSHSTAVLTNTTSIVCTGTATTGTCNLLIVADGRQAISGPALNVSTNDFFVASAMTRLSSTAALLCYMTSTDGSCVVVGVNDFGVVMQSSPVQFCPHSDCYDLALSVPINATNNVIFCYTDGTASTMTCMVWNASPPSITNVSSLVVGMGSWGPPSIAVLHGADALVCYADGFLPVTSTDIEVPLLTLNARGVCLVVLVGPSFTLALDPAIPMLQLTTTELTEKVSMAVVGDTPDTERALVCFVANREDAMCMGIFVSPFPYIASTVVFGPGFGVAQLLVTPLNSQTGLTMVCYQEIMQDALSCLSMTLGSDGTLDVSDNMISMTDDGALLMNIPLSLETINDTAALVATPTTVNTTGDSGQFVNEILILPFLQTVIGSVDTALVSLACVNLWIDELSTRRFCLGSPTQLAVAGSTPAPTLPNPSYCDVSLNWQCEARQDECDWIPTYGCKPATFCGATNSIDCAMLKATYLHPCSWSNGKCVLTGSTLPLVQLCPTIKTQSACPNTIGCVWFPFPIGCQAAPYCQLSTRAQCVASTGCSWVPTVGTAGICGLSTTS